MLIKSILYNTTTKIKKELIEIKKQYHITEPIYPWAET